MNLYTRVLLGVVAASVLSAGAMHFFFVHPVGSHLPHAAWHVYLIGFAAVVITSVFVVVPIQRQLSALGNTTRRLREGDLSARTHVHGSGPVGRLATHINEMTDEIQGLLGRQKELMQAVSHEFRTPLARLRFLLELVQTSEGQGDWEKRIGEMDRNLDELDALVEELLTYARLDDGGPALDKDQVDVRAVVADVVGTVAATSSKVTVTVPTGDPVAGVRVNARYFRRVIENLLLNALRHAKREVRVEVASDANAVRVCVHDDGDGVAPEDRARVWEPFSRLDDSRSRDSGGVGLGLAIVRRIVTGHAGTVSVDQSPLGGACFHTTWPLQD